MTTKITDRVTAPDTTDLVWSLAAVVPKRFRSQDFNRVTLSDAVSQFTSRTHPGPLRATPWFTFLPIFSPFRRSPISSRTDALCNPTQKHSVSCPLSAHGLAEGFSILLPEYCELAPAGWEYSLCDDHDERCHYASNGGHASRHCIRPCSSRGGVEPEVHRHDASGYGSSESGKIRASSGTTT